MLRGGWLVQTLLLGAALPMAVIAMTDSVAALMVSVIVVGAALALGGPVTMMLVADAVPGDLKATALSVRVAGNRLGQLTIPAVLGGVAALTGPPAVFVGACAGLLTASVWTRVCGMDQVLRSRRAD